MKKLITISIYLFYSFLLTAQENNLEFKHEPIKLTEKEFFENSTLIDTIIRQIFHSNGLVAQKQVICRIYNKNFGDTLLWLLDWKLYRPTGQIRRHITYTLDIVTESSYDIESIITFKVITEYEFKDPNKRIYIINPRGRLTPICYSKEFINYQNGHIIRRGKTKLTKKDGIWEYYNKETGDIEKTITYNMGKKISSNNIK